MYENYSRQALPSKEYRELLGSAIFVFNSNNAFILENILNHDADQEYSWYDYISQTSGKLLEPIKNTITKNSNTEISNKFQDVIEKRNRIIHSFAVTKEGTKSEPILRTKDKNHNQYNITEEYLLEFIKLNEELSSMLHDFRGY